MAEHNELGRIGEDEACYYLIHKGYHLRDRNWRFGHLEIDIVAELFGEIIFVEVKSRTHNEMDEAFRAVTLAKKQNLLAAAREYMKQNRLDGAPCRFDIVTVVGRQVPFEITHYPFAYTGQSVRSQAHHQKPEFSV